MEAKAHKMVPDVLKVGADRSIMGSKMNGQSSSRTANGLQNGASDGSNAPQRKTPEKRMSLVYEDDTNQVEIPS